MNTGEQIKKLRKTLDLTQQKFGERIGIKGNTVAQYELGRSNPVDSVFSLICREFNVNETWLRTGEGEMFIKQTTDEQITSFMSDLLKDEESSFKRRLISGLCTLDDEGWSILENFIDSIYQKQEQPAASLEPTEKDWDNMTVEEAEAEYIKSRSIHAQKKDSSVSNTTAGRKIVNQ